LALEVRAVREPSAEAHPALWALVIILQPAVVEVMIGIK